MKRKISIGSSGETILRAWFNHEQAINVDHCSPAMCILVDGILDRVYANPELTMFLEANVLDHGILMNIIIDYLESIGLSPNMNVSDILATIYASPNFGATLDTSVDVLIQRLINEMSIGMSLGINKVNAGVSSVIEVSDRIEIVLDMTVQAVIRRARMVIDNSLNMISELPDMMINEFFIIEEV